MPKDIWHADCGSQELNHQPSQPATDLLYLLSYTNPALTFWYFLKYEVLLNVKQGHEVSMVCAWEKRIE